ncbi:MAG: carboxylesterase family protein [Nitrospirae bacterium]|nr:carboxylesterase family protein [Nitrospirota bacterium]
MVSQVLKTISLCIALIFFMSCSSGSKGNDATPAPTPATTTNLGTGLIVTTAGQIQGKVSGGIGSYLGIPYAAPPTGNLRWKPPQAVTSWPSIRPAMAYGNPCPQHIDAQLNDLSGGGTIDEDCLYLNVWTPATSVSDALPVMVWIHGGGLIMGSGAYSANIGENLARSQNIVVVTINYRLGMLGFFANSELDAEDPDHVSGNYGFKDQIYALRWVRDNISSFGGDPGNVTIFGESAGALSVHILMVSPLAGGLFHRAIAESGTPLEKLRGLIGIEAIGDQFALKFGFSGPGVVANLRAKTWQEILAQDNSGVIAPGDQIAKLIAIDGKLLTDTPANLYIQGKEAAVPLLMGTNQDEGSLYVQKAQDAGWWTDPSTAYSSLVSELTQVYGDASCTNILNEYVINNLSTVEVIKNAYENILTDGTFIAPTRRTVRAHTAANNAAYLYHFTRKPPILQQPWASLGSYHGLEVFYVFGTFPAYLGFATEDSDLSAAMMGYWSRMALSGTPNGTGAIVAWPLYDDVTDQHLVLDSTISTDFGLRQSYCAFWDTIP